MKGKTIANNLVIDGIGLHSGQNVSIELLPSSCGYIYFSDKNNPQKQLKALFSNVIDTNLGTTIANAENINFEKFYRINFIFFSLIAIRMKTMLIRLVYWL